MGAPEGVMDVTLTGGEVFTRPDLFELIDGVIANRMRYTLLSNGTLIDENVLAKFESGNWYGIVVPANTPREIVDRVHRASVTALSHPNTGKRLNELGFVLTGT